MADTPQQQLSPADFAAKIKAKYPAYASMKDDELVSKVTAKYPQYKSQINLAPPDPLKTGEGMIAKAQGQAKEQLAKTPMKMQFSGKPLPVGDKELGHPMSEIHGAPEGLAGMLSIGAPGVASGVVGGGLLGSVVGGGAAGATGSISKQVLEHKNPLSKENLKETRTSILEGAGTGAVLHGAASGASKIIGKVDPLARLNKILGVGAGEVRVGSVPTSLDEFASNPARGVTKAGLTEKQVTKMNPLERVQKLTEVRSASGAKLDQVLQANAQKQINVQKVVTDVFKDIPDPKMVQTATTRLQQILQKANIDKPLSQLTPMEARTIQRELDEFANFAPEGATKSFRDVATALRRGISKATRQAIPETAELDQDYGDLAGAVKAVRRQANKYARTVPVSKLRKMAPYLATAAGAGAAGAAGVHHFLPSTP